MAELKVTYIVRKSGVLVSKVFPSEYLCRQFLNKARHSREIQLVAYPNLGK